MEIVEPIRDKKQLEAVKKVLRGSSLRNYSLFVLGINSGLRVSDLIALTVSDVMDERGKMKDRINLHEEKSGKAKDFPIAENARKALAEYLATRPNCPPEEPLFKSRKHGAIQRQQVWAIINEAARSVGIKDKIGTHTMRKTFGYHAYQDGRDLGLIMRLLNHSNPSVTLRYIGVNRDQMDRVYLSLNL